ncbi:MAG: ABC transporter ATP-binding protein/permease [Eubacteriaceae bacterium]|nr:ABC transporter ATP-binding protein/permease [Eubacteriaceae bacterium]
MKYYLKYIKPFLGGIAVAVVFLFVQNIADLALPTLMSNIINVGLQQGGLTSSAPQAISSEAMQTAQIFMSAEEKGIVASSYKLVKTSDTNESSRPYSELYPGAAESLYIKQQDSDDLGSAFSHSFSALMHYRQKEQGPAPTDELPKMQDYIALMPKLEALSAGEAAQIRIEALESTPPNVVSQRGTALSRSAMSDVGVNVTALQSRYILRIGGMMLLVAICSGAATITVNFMSNRISTGMGRNVRRAVFEKIESFSNAEIDKFSTASLITRCTNDVQTFQMVTGMGIRMLFSVPIMGIGGIVLALRTSVSMSWIIALAVITQLGLVGIITSIAYPKFQIVQRLTDRMNLVAREALSGLMVVRAFNTQEREKARFADASGEFLSTELFINRTMAFMMPVMTLVMNGLSLLIIWVGGHQIALSRLQIGNMMAFTQYSMMILMSFSQVSMMFQMIPRATVSIKRVQEVLDTQASIVDPLAPEEFNEADKGIVEFENVSFRYEEATNNAISEINFTALPGQTTAIIGSTGSGKSTIANLMLRFYDATEGVIKVGGKNVKDVTQHDLRDRIGYIPQKAVLLSGTIDYNLRYGLQDAEPDVIEWAAAIAQARGFITAKEEGYDQQIAQGGSNVSGGQKQRLSIARALVKKPDIFIFDDSFSALDFKTDSALRAALKEQLGDATVIIVAQRVSTIMGAEQIIVMDQGRIVGKGTHSELLKNCDEYFEIASSQLSMEELSA